MTNESYRKSVFVTFKANNCRLGDEQDSEFRDAFITNMINFNTKKKLCETVNTNKAVKKDVC